MEEGRTFSSGRASGHTTVFNPIPGEFLHEMALRHCMLLTYFTPCIPYHMNRITEKGYLT